MHWREALYDYEERHGYRGPVAQLGAADMASNDILMERLDALPDRAGLTPAAVLDIADDKATVRGADGKDYALTLDDVSWARKRRGVDTLGEEITAIDQVLGIGDVIQLQTRRDGSKRFVQEPKIEGAFVAMDPSSGEILALVGGFDFNRSKFNRATQARRQPGSTFKPFIYSAALEAGDTAATVYNDAPVVFHDDALEGEWRPSNYSGRFYGPTRLREALVYSRNLVSVRVLREIGIPYAIDYATRFGFARRNLPPDLSLALGSAAVTPVELTAAPSACSPTVATESSRISSSGSRILVARSSTPHPKVVLCDDCKPGQESPLKAEMAAEAEVPPGVEADRPKADDELAALADGEPVVDRKRRKPLLDTIDAPRVIDPRNAYIMSGMMREVVSRGTGRRAGEALKRGDFGGKTGTTNNQLDAWFAGFNSDIVAAAWVGSDGLDPLGRREAGGVAALPMWASFMVEQLGALPESVPDQPAGIETIRIDRRTGEPSAGDGTMLELFMEENMPELAESERSGDEEDVDRLDAADEGLSETRTQRERAQEVEQLF